MEKTHRLIHGKCSPVSFLIAMLYQLVYSLGRQSTCVTNFWRQNASSWKWLNFARVGDPTWLNTVNTGVNESTRFWLDHSTEILWSSFTNSLVVLHFYFTLANARRFFSFLLSLQLIPGTNGNLIAWLHSTPLEQDHWLDSRLDPSVTIDLGWPVTAVRFPS